MERERKIERDIERARERKGYRTSRKRALEHERE